MKKDAEKKNAEKAFTMLAFCLLKAVDLAFSNHGAYGFCEFPKVEKPNDEALKSRASHVLDSIKGAFYITLSPRGVGLKYGENTQYPVEFRPFAKIPFLMATLMELIKALIQLNIIDTLLKLKPGVDVLGDGSIFIPSLPWSKHYWTATYHILHWHNLLSGVNLMYHISTLIGVGIFSQSPRIWPPFFYPYALFTSSSLHQFWGLKWHQGLRRVLYVSGGCPGEWIAIRLGLPRRFMTVLGIYIASGLLHELPFYLTGYGLNGKVTLFYIAHAVFMEIECQWERLTKRRVGGFWGYLWFFCTFHVLGAKMCSEEYFIRGLGVAQANSTPISPVLEIVIPALLYMGMSYWA